MWRELEFLNFGPWALVWTFLSAKAKICAQNKAPYSKDNKSDGFYEGNPRPWAAPSLGNDSSSVTRSGLRSQAKASTAFGNPRSQQQSCQSKICSTIHYSSCFPCDSGALEKKCQNDPRDCMDCSRRLHCLAAWTAQLHCTGKYSPQNPATLLTAATERSPSDPSWNAGWHADIFEIISRNSKFTETVNSVLNIGFSNHGHHRKTVHFEMHTQPKQRKLSLLRYLLYIWSAKAMLSKLHCV